MISQYFKQAWMVMKQNPFYSFISIISTAVAIAFVMTAYVAYDLNSSDIAPEINRTRLLYTKDVYAYKTEGHSNVNRGMSYRTAKAIGEDLSTTECVSLFTNNSPYTCEAVGGEGGKERRTGRFVDTSWWKIFQYEFVAGRPFSEEDYASNRKVVVVTENVARMLFLSTDVAGREMMIDYIPYTICGVIKDVSSQFTIAYGDFWANLTAIENIKEMVNGSEGVNGMIDLLALAKKGKIAETCKEMEEKVSLFNRDLRETTFHLQTVGHNEYTFSVFFDFTPTFTYALLVSILLLIPAVSISGLISSMLDKRYEEIAVRKVYGAAGGTIINQFLSENLLLVFLGGITGLLLSFLTVYLFRSWLLGVSVAYLSSLNLSWWMFFSPSIFMAAFAVCLLFNILSTLIPVWQACNKKVVDIFKS